MRSRLPAVLLVVAAAAAAGACGRRSGPAGPRAAEEALPDRSATLEVRSNYTAPLDVSAYRDRALVRRLGSVVPARVTRFRLGPDVITAGPSLQIVAVPRGSTGGGASTGPLVVRPGDTVEFNVGADLRSNSVFVRQSPADGGR